MRAAVALNDRTAALEAREGGKAAAEALGEALAGLQERVAADEAADADGRVALEEAMESVGGLRRQMELTCGGGGAVAVEMALLLRRP